MIVSKQKPFDQLLMALGDRQKVFLIGCAKCATVCKSGGEEQVWQMQEALTAEGREVTGSIIIDEACHMLRVQRDLRSKQEMVDNADALLVLADHKWIRAQRIDSGVAGGRPTFSFQIHPSLLRA